MPAKWSTGTGRKVPIVERIDVEEDAWVACSELTTAEGYG